MPSAPLVMRTAAGSAVSTPEADHVGLIFDSEAAIPGEPAWVDESGTVRSLQGADGALEFGNHGNTGASEDIDAQADEVHQLVLNAATVTLTTSNWPASGTPQILLLKLVQDATGGRLVSWPTITWIGDVPVLQTAANAVDFVTLFSHDGGTTIYGWQGGKAGPGGGAISIDYLFSTTTTDADPGSGVLRLSNATQTSATAIRADLNDRRGTAWTAVIDSLDDSTNTVKGHIRLYKSDDPSKWLLFTVSAVGSETGYRNITVANVAGSASSPFAAGDPVTLAFTRAGDEGAAGGGGSHSTLGTTSVGATGFRGGRGLYVKKITLPSDGFVTGLWAHVKGNGSNGVGMHPVVYADSAGSPTNLIMGVAGAITSTPTRVFAMILNTTARWVFIPLGAYLAAGDYWFGFWAAVADVNHLQLAYASSGSDKTQSNAAEQNQPVDSSIQAFASPGDDYSIYIDFLA